MALRLNHRPVVHVRYDGRSFDLPLAEIDLGAEAGDAEVKRVLARVLGVTVDRLRDYEVDRHQSGNLTLRPEAVFG